MIKWPSPAKINLFLHITGRRPDGYHELQTAFQFLDYCDYLSFEVNDTGRIDLATPIAGVDNQNNLIVRAAKLLQTSTACPQGVTIHLEKNLPMGGGLGGGSSNAATTLLVLNQLWQTKKSVDELAQMGLALGADVPVFARGYAAWAEGVGEKLTAISPPEPWYIVIVPNCHVSTAQVFSSQELTRDCETITIPRFLSGEGSNVCEQVVVKQFLPVAEALDWLKQYAEPRMTGTGACVFAGFDSQEKAQQVMTNLPEGWQGFVAKGCNQSPLISAMNTNVMS